MKVIDLSKEIKTSDDAREDEILKVLLELALWKAEALAAEWLLNANRIDVPPDFVDMKYDEYKQVRKARLKGTE